MRSRIWKIGAIATLAVATIALLNGGASADGRTVRAVLHNAAGTEIGVVKFIQQGDGVLVKADGLGFPGSLSSGFKGFHVHANGVCDPAAVDPATGGTGPFFSAGGGLHPPPG